MKKHTTKRAFLSSALSLLLCVAMLIGTTFAWFTDSVTSSGNIIKSGNLDVTMAWAEGTEAVPTTDSDWTDASKGAIFNYDKWEPGYTEVRHIKIANVGTLALKYQLNIVATGEVSELADVIDVYYMDPATQVEGRANLTEENKIGTLTQVLAGLSVSGNGVLVPADKAGNGYKSEETVTIALKMQESAGNEYQDKAIGSDFAVQLLATQMTYEEDSFDNQYDTDAEYPMVTSEVVSGGGVLTVGDVTVTIPAGAPDGTYTLEVNNKNTVKNTEETSVSYDINLLKNGVKVEPEAGISYSVSIDVGRLLALTGVQHNGMDVTGYAYDPTTGIVSFETDSFSPFSVRYKTDTYYAYDAEDLQEIITKGGTAILANDITVDKDTEFTYTEKLNGAHFYLYYNDLTLDLNGHNITVKEDALMDGKTTATALFLVRCSTLNIKGEGTIETKNQAIPVYGWTRSEINIYGGTYKSNCSLRNESAVYVNNDGVFINVYGGDFTQCAYAFNVHDTSGQGTAPVIVLHEGISYYDFFKPNNSTDLIANDLKGGRIGLAEGCELQEVGSLNTVVKK